ncbi:MAG: DUF4824 family protein [Rhodocyclaceae bacterium]|nr:DUF4824 family protein [Rhodocyclaceae bacterium]
MKRWTSAHTLGAGIALIVLTNAVALGGVWWNRAAPPESTLTLSERELGLPWRSLRTQENSGLALTLRWRVASLDTGGDHVSAFTFNGGTPEWLDGAKLQTLGFEVGDPNSDTGRRRFTRQQPRPVIAVLELDGPARQQALGQARENAARHAAAAEANPDSKEFAGRAKSARDALAREENWNSRLFAIDAGVDAERLRAQYPDRTHFMLVPATVRPRLHHPKRGAPQLAGYITRLDNASLHVPHAMIAPLEGMHARTDGEPGGEDRFNAVVATGHRLEPWIEAIQVVSKSGN